MKLTVDARMCAMSGIGRYIRSVLPYLCDSFDTAVIVNKNADLSFLNNRKFSVIQMKSEIYTVREQAELPLRVPLCDVFWSPHYNVPLFNIKARRRAVTIHDVYHLAYFGTLTVPQKIYAKALMSAAVRKSDVIFTNSDFSGKEILRFTAAKGEKIRTVYPGIDVNMFAEKDNQSENAVRLKYNLPETFILCVGNVKPHKNLKTLLIAMQADKSLNLVIVGKKEGFITGDEEIFDALDKDKELASRVVMTGQITDHEMTSMYHMADVFVFPSYYEGFGLPVLEAQACLCPVAASDSAGIPEAAGDGALYFTHNEPQSLLSAINAIRYDGQTKKHLIKLGKININKFGWDKTAAAIISFLSKT